MFYSFLPMSNLTLFHKQSNKIHYFQMASWKNLKILLLTTVYKVLFRTERSQQHNVLFLDLNPSHHNCVVIEKARLKAASSHQRKLLCSPLQAAATSDSSEKFFNWLEAS